MSGQPIVGTASIPLRLADCWNSIGVRGDGSCPELKRCVHCRSCPVYSTAAIGLLDIDSPAGYVADWTAHLAKPAKTDEGKIDSVFIFRIGPEWLALPACVIKEVADWRSIHSLPHRHTGGLLGLANVRGELLICVSLLQMLGLEQSVESKPHTERAGHQRLLVIRHEKARMACPVDDVHGIHRVHPRDLKDVPATVAKAATTCSKAVVSWRSQSVGLLDAPRLFGTLQRSLA